MDEISNTDMEALHAAATNGDKNGFIFVILRLNLSETGRRFAGNHRDPKRYHQTVLMQAIKRGCLGLVTFIVDELLSPDALEARCKLLRNGPGAIHLAVKRNQFRIVDLLLARAPHLIEARNEAGDTPLLCAAEAGLLDMIQYLIDVKEANLDAKNDNGETALLRAVWSGNLECVKFFVEKGVSLQVVSEKDGYSVAEIAAANGHVDIFSYLVELNSQFLNSRDLNGATLLHTVAKWCHVDSDTLSLRKNYEENGYPEASNPELLDPDDDVDFAFNSEIVWAIRKYECGLKIAELLVESGADLLAVDNAGNTALHLAAESGNVELVRLFLEHAPAELVLAKNCQGQTALDLAREEINGDCQKAVVKFLVDFQKKHQPQFGSQMASRKRHQMTP